ncbi:DEAD/DEAH box helicase [Vibrio fluvialis]
MHIVPKSFDIESKPEINHIVDNLRRNEERLGLEHAQLFLEFPLYKDDNSNVVITQALLISPNHGVVIIYSSAITRLNHQTFKFEENQLDKVAGHITSKLFRNDKLRAGLGQLAIPIHAILLTRHVEDENILTFDSKFTLVDTTPNFISYLESSKTSAIRPELLEETISSLQGAKGLLKPAERNISHFDGNTKVAKVHQIESKILQFDHHQQDGYIPAVNGPHRIRGLAGSGKTVILAMKVVQTLLRERNTDVSILYTFSTKSLYQHVGRLIHRFFREFHDDNSFLDCVNIMHAWGGRTNPGVYYNACLSHNVIPLTLTVAQSKSLGSGLSAFEYACKTLLESTTIEAVYDYVFVDEAQDYGPYYLQLCTKLAKNNRVTFGSDVFQNIFQPKVITGPEILGDGLDFVQDDILEVCYRTPRTILIAAHAIGLGVYGQQVQVIDSVDSWQDFGYEVQSRAEGNFELNEHVKVHRSEDNSPILIHEPANDLVKYNSGFSDTTEEVNFVANCIINDIQSEGLLPEDILVICMDDRGCNSYFTQLDIVLNNRGITTNNTHANKYSINDFHVKGRVTLSTIHKAKGNEAYSVYLIGCDAVCHNLNVRNRNLLFTAMTRTKGWLRLTAYRAAADELFHELETALQHCPNIVFNYPSEEGLQRIQRDLFKKAGTEERQIKKLEEIAKTLGGTEELEKILAELRAREDKK